ncbi:hypothetical protein OPV22_032342 [Ensete ventricosum]|uniref:Aspartic peptidase DDI1-type domain-containing protein n=1 Tax=Ensete ventricosum TaxID=4639 RepID=A0AAV8P011_ENSVE|nr:hypothetical protein OPV22_032342 [Ensete ventricosum]
MYVDIKLNGRITCAMVDTGTTYNFIANRKAKLLGLILEKSPSRMKAMNSEAKRISRRAKGVPIKIGTWSRSTNLIVVPLDDFQVMLRMEFMHAVKLVPMSFLNFLYLMEGDDPCVVPVSQGGTKDPQQISTFQLKKGVRKGESAFVAAMKLETLDGEAIQEPTIVANILKEFSDMMPMELPRTLPPCRGVDHRIELELGVKPLVRTPYRMALPELAELRKQLDKLLSGGLICSSKAPFGASVLFQKKQDRSL